MTEQWKLSFVDTAVADTTHVNLSAVRVDDGYLWVAGDEAAAVERLTLHADGASGHVRFDLHDLVELPGDPDDEVDIEGLARCGPYLWAVGSHSAKRRRAKPEHDDAKVLRRLGSVRAEKARRVLVRVPIAPGPDGAPTPVSTHDDHSAAALPGGLTALLTDDEHLAPFIGIPGKDNGLDVEGIAVHGEPGAETVHIGLRGPVLRGWAVVIELRPRDGRDGELALEPFDDGRRYRLHVLDLDGLGIRDLCPDGDDLLILAGPTMVLDGPVRVLRWPGAADGGGLPDAVRRDELPLVTELTHGVGADRPEGIALLPDGRLLVVYDSPASWRLPEPGVVLADVLRLADR